MSVARQTMSKDEFNEIFGQLLKTIDHEKLRDLPSHMRKAVRSILNKQRKKSMDNSRKRVKRLRANGELPEMTKDDQAAHRRSVRNKVKHKKGKITDWQYWYSQYLLTPEWIRIRGLIMRRDSHKCRCCGRTATEVHHRSYKPDVMVGKDLSQLVAMCDECHTLIHKDGDAKRPMAEVDAVLLAMLKVPVSE